MLELVHPRQAEIGVARYDQCRSGSGPVPPHHVYDFADIGR